MNITIKPWKPGDGGLICLPLRSNIPDASKHPDWRLVTCPSCGRECWEPELARQVKGSGSRWSFVPCALSGPQTHREEVKRRNDRSRNHARRRRVCNYGPFSCFVSNRTVVTHKDAKKKAAELHMVAYATYQLSLRIDELNNSKTKKEDPENEENKRTE